MSAHSCAISVVIRVRPLQTMSSLGSADQPWHLQDTGITQVLYEGDRVVAPGASFSFDRVFPPATCSNQSIFESVTMPIVDGALSGVNGTVFAYGQTSAGKTFTMQGTEANPGLIPLAIDYIFRRNDALRIRASYLEIYNEVVTDLIRPDNTNLKIHETTMGEIYAGNLTEVDVSSAAQALAILANGQVNRTIGKTNMNEYSSRSHTIYQMTIESRPGNSHRAATLSFIDLAGSERVRLAGSEGIRLKEGGHINRSLLSLATVISKLAEGSPHVPFRDSKLTRLLQPSLGGNSQTLIICAVTPQAQFVDETISTLKFASRAKCIQNKPCVNEIVTQEVRLQRYERQIHELQLQVAVLKDLDVCEMGRALQGVSTELSDLMFIFAHSEADVTCQLQSIVDGCVRELTSRHEQLAFLQQEKAVIEATVVHENEALRRQLKDASVLVRSKDATIAELQASNQRLGQQILATEEHLMAKLATAPSSANPKQLLELSMSLECLDRAVDTHTKHYREQLLSRTQELANRQADIDDLLSRFTSQQCEWRSKYGSSLFCRNEQLSLDVEQMAEAQRQRERADGNVRAELRQAVEEASALRARLDEAHKASAERDTRADELQLRCASLEHQLQTGREALETLRLTHEASSRLCSMFSTREAELTTQLREAMDRLTLKSQELQGKESSVVLLEVQQAQMKQDHAELIRSHAEQARHLQEKISALEAANEAHSKCRLNSDELDARIESMKEAAAIKESGHAQLVASLNDRLAAARADADRRAEELSALKKRADAVEAELRADLTRCERELQEAASRKDSTNVEVALRIELDRLNRTLSKERRLFELKLSDIQEQLAEAQAEKRVETPPAKRAARDSPQKRPIDENVNSSSKQNECKQQ